MPQIELTPAERREQRAQAHHLDPVVLVEIGDPRRQKEIDRLAVLIKERRRRT
jgi:RNA-binding protein